MISTSPGWGENAGFTDLAENQIGVWVIWHKVYILSNILKIKMPNLNKKSQLYIITALFLCALVFIMNTRPEKLEKSGIDFSGLYLNFMNEAKYVVNSAIYQNRNLTADFNEYVDEYIRLAATEGVNASLFYIIVYENDLYLGNRIGEEANITTATVNFILTKNNRTNINRGDWLNAEIGSTDYLFNTTLAINGPKFVLKMQQGDKKEVRVYGQ